MEKQHLLYIEPYVEIDIVGDKVLFMNTLDGKNIEMADETFAKLLSKELYSFPTRHIILNHDEYKRIYDSFVMPLKRLFFADTIALEESDDIPAAFPRFNAFRDFFEKRAAINKNFISHITVRVNNQIECDRITANDDIFAFLSICRYSSNVMLTIALKTILFSEKLLEKLSNIWKEKFVVRLNGLENNICETISSWRNYSLFKIGINKSYDSILSKIKDYITSDDEVILYVHSESSFIEANLISERYPKYNIIIWPEYGVASADFLDRFVNMGKDDILSCKMSRKMFMRRLTINPHFWGHIELDSFGDIIANNKSTIGTVKDDPVTISNRCVSDEKKSLWRMTRLNVMPCRECIYRLLCPPISDGELSTGRYNLCTVANNDKQPDLP